MSPQDRLYFTVQFSFQRVWELGEKSPHVVVPGCPVTPVLVKGPLQGVGLEEVVNLSYPRVDWQSLLEDLDEGSAEVMVTWVPAKMGGLGALVLIVSQGCLVRFAQDAMPD